MFALLLNQILVSYFLEVDGYDPKVKLEIFQYFGTFSRAMLSMFEITLGNWVPVARLLLDGVNEWFMVFSLLHKVSMGFAVIAVINGIFIQETFKVAACDDTLMLLQEQRAEQVLHAKMCGLFEAADRSGDGGVDLAEFRTIMLKPHVRTWLAAQQLDASDADKLFELLDKAGDEVTVTDFIKGVGRLKGSARSVDLLTMERRQGHIQKDMVELHKHLCSIERHLASGHSQSLAGGICQVNSLDKMKPSREETACTTCSLLQIPEERAILADEFFSSAI